MAQGADTSPSAVIRSPSAALRLGTAGQRVIMRIGWSLSVLLLFSAVATSSRWLGRNASAVSIAVDGRIELVYSMRPDVGSVLDDLGLRVRPEDLLTPSADTALNPGLVISLRRARPYRITIDGEVQDVSSHVQTVGELLSEAGVRVYPYDEVLLEGALVEPEALLPTPNVRCVECNSHTVAPPRTWVGDELQPVRLEIHRAVPLKVDDGSVPFTIWTTAPTVGEALLRAGMLLYLGDTVRPRLGSSVQADMRVAIVRSKLLLITADGQTVRTRTQRDTVGDSLMELGIVVSGGDRTIPNLDERIVDNMEIRVVRVLEAVQVDRKPISYESVMAPDDQLELDQQRLAQAGQDGEFRSRFRVVYEDGREVSRNLMDEWVASDPVRRIVSYGRRIVSRPLETSEGTLSYWRKLQMYATSYSPARSGTPQSAPWYGRTRIGQQLRKGLVAVDPKVIPLGTRLYVPGYGVAVAADTGGGVRGRMIDLGYEDGNYQSWHWWVEVYILDPIPSTSSITWVLPKYPEGRFPYIRK
jgi:resuscitation-promoting factor RpfB